MLIACSHPKKGQNKADGGPARLAPPALSVALAGLPRGPIAARLDTSEGPIHCQLERAAAPQAVALFVGLATGRAPWLDVHTKQVVTRPMYRNLAFFRAVPNAFVQSGCPLGNGTGTPGYRITVEPTPDDARRLAQPGALLLVGYHAPTNRVDPSPPAPSQIIGSQFVIGLGDLSHLAGRVSVLGSCGDLERVRGIAKAVAARERDVRLVRVVVDGVAD